MRTCGFCGGSGVNKEHVWPDWMRKIILAERGAPGKRFGVEHEQRGHVTRFRSADLETRVGMPCGKCNNGWMRDLEDEVRPFMTGMVHPGQKTLLTAERRRLLARWALKTAMVFEFVREREAHYFTAAERRELMASPAPGFGASVWLGRYWAMRPMHAHQDRKRHESGVVVLYTFTLTAQFFAMQVAARRDTFGRVPVTNLPDGGLIQIWPDRKAGDELLMWPPTLTMGEYGLSALDTRFRNEGLEQVSAELFES